MKFSFAAVLALAASVLADRAASPNPEFDPVTSPTKHQKVVAGTSLTIKWTVPAKYASTKVNLILIGGPEQNAQTPLLTIVENIDNSLGAYTWSVPTDQGGLAWYGLIIEDVADTYNNYQYSDPFDLEKSDASSSSGATSTVTLTTASGTATVILSSAVPTTTSVSSTAAVTTSTKEASSEVKTTVVSSSAPAYPTMVTVTASSVTVVAASSTKSATAAQSSTVLVNASAAVQSKAGVLAVLAGLAVALML